MGYFESDQQEVNYFLEGGIYFNQHFFSARMEALIVCG